MPPKQRWALVPGSVPASTMEAAKEQLRTFNDLGKNPKYEWIRTVGGSADRCQYFSCGAHVDCPVKLKAYIMGDVFLLAKLQDMDHADEIQCYDRANASKCIFMHHVQNACIR